MPLFQKINQVDEEVLGGILWENWGIKIREIIKRSQNHTYCAEGEHNTKYAVRVTPGQKHLLRITKQLKFVNFVKEKGFQYICAPVLTLHSKQLLVHSHQMIICVFAWAQGALLPFHEFEWLTVPQIISAWGKCFASLHNISRGYEEEGMQEWNEIHGGIMKGVVLHQEDVAQMKEKNHYGVLHGDLNCSNFFYVREEAKLWVFDTDQVQRGFYQWDLAQAIFASVMLSEAGMPISGDPVPQANTAQFSEIFIKGYEQISIVKVNRQRLARMIQLKKLFYQLFCAKAIEEGNIPPDMKPFITYVNQKLV